MKTTLRRKPGTLLTEDQKRQVEALAKKPDSEIDFSDAPVLPAEAWKDAVRGRLYRPVKQAVSLRLDADVIAWLKKDGDGYQTRANKLLRERMLEDVGVVPTHCSMRDEWAPANRGHGSHYRIISKFALYFATLGGFPAC